MHSAPLPIIFGSEAPMSTTVRLSLVQSRSLIEGIVRKVAEHLPEGRPIPGEVWDRRHAGIVKLV